MINRHGNPRLPNARPAQHAAAPVMRPPRPRHSTGLLIMVAVLVVFMVAPEGFDYANAGIPSSGSPFSRMVWLTMLGTGFIYAFKHLKDAKAVLLGNRYLFGFVVLAGLSYLWSIEPGVTLRREIRILAVTFATLAYAVSSTNTRAFQLALRPVLTLLLAGSIIFVLTSPKIAVEQLEFSELLGAWKGLTTQKNALGSLSAIGTLLWLHAWLTGQVKQPFPLIGVAVSATCLLNSRSSTSIMATVFASCLMMMMLYSPKSMKRYMPYFIAIFVCVLLLYSLAVLNLVSGLGFMLKPITTITGKDLTFSGRTEIWEILREHMAGAPWLGTGYGAYWLGIDPASPSFQMLVKLEFYPSEAHNGYMDIFNDLGRVGGVLLFAYILLYLKQALQLFSVDKAQGALFLVLLFEQMIANMSESMWWNARTVEFAIMTLATVCLSRAVILTRPPPLRERIKAWRQARAQQKVARERR